MRILGILNKRKLALAGSLSALALVATGCAGGAYAVDIFPEMHYQQSFRIQEPPRRYPAEGSVPVNGREVVPSAEVAKTLKNPFPQSAETQAQAKELFRVNCAMCHGPSGKGDGAVGAKLVANGYLRPPDLTAQTTQAKTDGELFLTLTNGVVVMPKFGLLLTEEDRWALVQYLRTLK